MQSDAMVWETINNGHCTYKVKTLTQNFCRNEYNVTGLCNRSSCPLANSRYATIREHEGRLFLYVKVPERAHQPAKMWEKVRLRKGYLQALEQLDRELEHWPHFLVHKNKQRLTKITQYLLRMRRLQLRPRKTLLTLPRRTEKRDARREQKALKAANLDRAIEAELVRRLKAGTYGDIYNFSQAHYERVLSAAEADAQEAEDQLEGFVEGDSEDESEEESEGEGEAEEEGEAEGAEAEGSEEGYEDEGEGESEEEEEWEAEGGRQLVDGEALGLESELVGGGDLEDLADEDLPGLLQAPRGARPSGRSRPALAARGDNAPGAKAKRRVSFADEQPRKRKGGRGVEIEYEEEREGLARRPLRTPAW